MSLYERFDKYVKHQNRSESTIRKVHGGRTSHRSVRKFSGFFSVKKAIFRNDACIAKGTGRCRITYRIRGNGGRRKTGCFPASFSACFGIKANLDNFTDPVARNFLDVDYYGYLLGNELLPRVIPGCYPDSMQTARYTAMIKSYLGLRHIS